MAFTFQINSDVEFNHDEKLLTKALEFKPSLKYHVLDDFDIVELCKDKSKLEGVGVKKVAVATDLDNYKLKRDGKIILDFKQHCVGKFSIRLEHVGSPMDAPLTLRIRFAEMPTELTYSSADYDGWLSKSWIQEEILHFDSLPIDLKLPRRYSFRFIELSVIDTSPKWSVVFKQPKVKMQSSVTSWNLQGKKFSDEDLTKIYAVSQKTLAECMQEVFEDGPKRDQRLWLGDLRLQALANYATFNQAKIVKYCLYLFGAMSAKDGRIPANVFTGNQLVPDDTFMLDYGLFFVAILNDYLKRNNDQEMLVDLYPVAVKQVDYVLKSVTDDGKLIVTEDYPAFVDWSNDFNKDTAAQAILIYVLKQFIELTKRLGRDASKYQFQLEKLSNYVLTEYFDTQQGLFVSGKKREVNIASQVWMVLAHVLDDSENKKLMTKATKKLFPITGIATPYMYHHIVEALFVAGLNEDALKLMKEYWGKMVSLGADTFWEAFDPTDVTYSPYGSPIVNSYCHAWSCTPVYLLDKYLV